MKREHFVIGFTAFLFIIVSLFSHTAVPVLAHEGHDHEETSTSTAPAVSIGIGNGNSPENTGPTHGSILSGLIPVYATVTDANNDLDNYHFRILKDGLTDGYTCDYLFAEGNQGYASSTIGKSACGYNFNQSIYFSPTGFSNMQIATINAADLIAFAGEGDYWFIIGARDIANNRYHADYLQDPRVKITIASTTPTPEATTTATTTPPSGSNTGVAPAYSGGSGYVSPSTGGTNPVSPLVAANTFYPTAYASDGIGGDADASLDLSDANGTTTATSTATTTSETTDNSNQLASVTGSGVSSWWWLLLLLIPAGYIVYRSTKND